MNNQDMAAYRSDGHGTEPERNPWRGLYRIAAVAALLSAAFIPVQIAVLITNPFPTDAAGWFEFFQRNMLIALLDLDILLVADNLLLIPILLALYVTLRKDSESLMALGVTTAIIGIPLFIASNPAFEMLALSDRYAAATTDVERSGLLAAGQMLLATWQGTAFQAGYLLASIGGLLIAVAMLRSGVFSKAIGYLGFAGNAIGLGLFFPVVGLYLAVVSVLPLEVWYVLLGIRFIQLSRIPAGRSVARESASDLSTAHPEFARKAG